MKVNINLIDKATIILLVVPTSNVIINRVSITRQDSYTTIVITKEDVQK